MRILIALIALLASLPSSAAAAPRRYEYSEIAMGVRARIVVYAGSEEQARAACRAAFDRIAQLEDVMSDYRPTSELMRLCARAGGPPVKISPDLLSILRLSEDLSRRSDGAFDVTIGPMVRLWRTARRSRVLPSRAELDAARRLVGWRKLHIDSKLSTVRLDVPGMQLDLGGIAKGYACDAAQRVLKRQGIKSALVEMGGDIAVSGPPPGKSGWQIDLANTPDPQRWALLLTNRGISSSGDTEQFVEIEGKRYSHIVDPRTGVGLTDGIAVTVIAPNCTTSDGLSTAISVLGEEKGRELLKDYPGTSAYVRRASWLTTESSSGSGTTRTSTTTPTSTR